MEFVPLEQIDPMYFDRPYYLDPQKQGAKAYALLRVALKKSGQVGIAKVVIKTRQHLAAIKPGSSALVLELMHFSEELIKPDSLSIPGAVDLGSKELDMAAELIDRMTGQWDPEKYTDDYRHALLDLIQKKIELGGKTPAGAPPSARAATKVVDLVSVLQDSLKQAGREKSAGHRRVKRTPAHKKTLKKAA